MWNAVLRSAHFERLWSGTSVLPGTLIADAQNSSWLPAFSVGWRARGGLGPGDGEYTFVILPLCCLCSR
jgi:hypothetical protein